jgi:predicted Zn-dependent peptidase
MPFHQHTFSNGLEVIGETIPAARSVAFGFFVKTGSRDERPEEAGVSHFLEHMMFKGTPRRTAMDVNLDFDRIGAQYNAYTSEEHTVYYASVLPEYLPHVIDILGDILRPSLRQEDFDTEKQVILEEIKMYEDSPASTAWDRARRIYFADHPLGNTILGTTESIRALTREQMQHYYDRRYGAGNIVAVAAGQFEWPRLLDLLAEVGRTWPNHSASRRHLGEARGAGGIHILTKGDVSQENVLLLGAGAPAESPLRYAAATMALAIGDDTGSRLYWELVHPGRVESASCGSEQDQGCGLMVTSFTCDPADAAENLAITQRILEQIQREGLTAQELEQAKNKITSRLVRSSERPMGRMRSIAGSWLYLRELTDLDTELSRFDAVDLSAIREYLDRYPINQTTVIGYGPLETLTSVPA